MLVYEGQIDFRFNEGDHKYTVAKKVGEAFGPSTPVTGVSTIVGVINKPSLMLWPMREAITYLKGISNPNEADYLDASKAHRKKSDGGKRAGKVGHALVEALLEGKKVAMPTEPELSAQAESIKSAFENWQADFEPEVVATETPFYSQKFNYAGTYDLLCKIGGKLTLVDFKTTNPGYYNPEGIYAENFVQLGGYSLGSEEMEGHKIEEMMVVNLPKNGDTYKVKAMSDMGLTKTDLQLCFINCSQLYELYKLIDFKMKG